MLPIASSEIFLIAIFMKKKTTRSFVDDKFQVVCATLDEVKGKNHNAQ